MSQQPDSSRSEQHPTVTEHPEQRRQEETGREDPEEVSEVGRPPAGEAQEDAQRKRRLSPYAAVRPSPESQSGPRSGAHSAQGGSQTAPDQPS